MKRNHFVVFLLLIATVPLKLFAHSSLFNRTGKGIKIAAGEGRIHGHIRLGGPNPSILDVKISGSDTDGNFAVFEDELLARGCRVPTHFHPEQDEMFDLLEGSVRAKVGDETFELGAGDSIFMPRNVPHAWIVLSDKAKMHILVQPAGKLENFFVTVAGLDHTVKHTADELKKISADNGMIVVGPPLELE